MGAEGTRGRGPSTRQGEPRSAQGLGMKEWGTQLHYEIHPQGPRGYLGLGHQGTNSVVQGPHLSCSLLCSRGQEEHDAWQALDKHLSGD